MNTIAANIVDVVKKRVFFGQVHLSAGKIDKVVEVGEERARAPYLIPGFVDAHVHIESSMLIPDEFARAAIAHGTLASVSDPHEIVNVLGMEGFRFMVDRAKLTPFTILFGAPSCVPATAFETAGAEFTLNDMRVLLHSGQAGYVSEMMNFPGVLNDDPDVKAKLSLAEEFGVPVDGHAPGLKGDRAAKYVHAGISTDHECTSLQEAEDKIAAGMHILIREGSAARDFNVLHPLLKTHPHSVMLCSDDKHPDDLQVGHVKDEVVRAINLGYALMDVLRAATFNPVKHYGLSLGLLQAGDSFDALLVDNLKSFAVETAWIQGQVVAKHGKCLLDSQPVTPINRFVASEVTPQQLQIPHPGSPCRVIQVKEGSLYTRKVIRHVPETNGWIAADASQDIAFLVVLNRYSESEPAVALVTGFGIQDGAIASSVAHDSHNIVAVGSSAEHLATVINEVIKTEGGLAAVNSAGVTSLPLPIAGLMSDQPCEIVGPQYKQMNEQARNLGSPLHAPFMTLSFMALLVIPELKLSDRGLFDGTSFQFCSLAASTEELPGPTPP